MSPETAPPDPAVAVAAVVSPDAPPSAETPGALWPDLSLLGAALIWGVNLPVMKLGLHGIAPFAFNALRLLISVIVLGGLAFRERSRVFDRPPGWQRQILYYAVTAAGVYQWAFLLAVTRTTSGNGSLIMATVPMWTAVLARLFLNERLSRTSQLGLAITFLGTLVVVLEKGVSGEESHLTGNFFMLTAALTWAMGTVQSRRALKFVSPLRLSAVAAALMLPFHFLFAATTLSSIVPHLPQSSVWVPLLYAGALSTGLALPMWNYGVGHLGAAHAAVFQNLVPVVAMASAWLLHREPVTLTQLSGGTLIITGLVLMRRGRTA